MLQNVVIPCVTKGRTILSGNSKETIILYFTFTTIPYVLRLCQQVLLDTDTTIQWCMNKHLLADHRNVEQLVTMYLELELMVKAGGARGKADKRCPQ